MGDEEAAAPEAPAEGSAAPGASEGAAKPTQSKPVSNAKDGETDAPAAGDGGSDATGSPEEPSSSDPPSSSSTFDQSYAWMLQLVILVTVMTLFFPFLRRLFGAKPRKQQTVSYRTYDSDEECDYEDCSDDEEHDQDFCQEE